MAETGNRVSSEFDCLDDLAQAITHAKTFGMRDITVTTVHHPARSRAVGGYERSVTRYYLECGMLTDREPDAERQLAHVDEVRAAVQHAKASA